MKTKLTSALILTIFVLVLQSSCQKHKITSEEDTLKRDAINFIKTKLADSTTFVLKTVYIQDTITNLDCEIDSLQCLYKELKRDYHKNDSILKFSRIKILDGNPFIVGTDTIIVVEEPPNENDTDPRLLRALREQGVNYELYTKSSIREKLNLKHYEDLLDSLQMQKTRKYGSYNKIDRIEIIISYSYMNRYGTVLNETKILLYDYADEKFLDPKQSHV